MNKEYLEKFYEENKERLFNSESEIGSVDDLTDYITSTISSNVQYDFNLIINTNSLFNLDNDKDIGDEIE
ncbi:MAG: hypothetical protein Q4G04_04885 [bacterium]|nr:hypothetical protein [bacterium]